jgi:NAD(P)H-hydrate epimerase
MATAGSGDVLSGILLALLAGGLPPFEAALLGAYLHGLAGDLAADEMGETSLIAGDILERLPDAFGLIEESDEDIGLLNVFAGY